MCLGECIRLTTSSRRPSVESVQYRNVSRAIANVVRRSSMALISSGATGRLPKDTRALHGPLMASLRSRKERCSFRFFPQPCLAEGEKVIERQSERESNKALERYRRTQVLIWMDPEVPRMASGSAKSVGRREKSVIARVPSSARFCACKT